MKKGIALLLAGTLVAGSFAPITVKADAGETYNVVMQWPTMGNAPAGLIDVENAINEITGPEIGVTVTLEPVDLNSLANETSLAIASGEQLDLCLSLFTGVGTLASTGSIIQLNDLYEKYGSDIAAALGTNISGGYYGTDLYGIPNSYIRGEKFGYVCRKDILDKYNISIDEDKVYTMEELGDVFSTVKEGEGDKFYCVGGTNANSELFGDILFAVDTLGASSASGVLMLGRDMETTTVENMFATDEYKKYAETMYEWAQNGYFSPDASTNTDDGPTQVRGGNYLGWFAGPCSGGAQDFITQTGMDMTVITTIEPISIASLFQSILWSIPVTSENPEKAMEFLNYIFKDQRVCDLLQFGIEGTDYVVIEDNGEDKLIDFPDGLDATSVPYYQVLGVYGNRLEWPIRVPNDIEMNNRMKAFDASVKNFSPALGYCFVVDNVSTQYSAVNAVILQYEAAISTGSMNPDTALPEFLSALEAAGIDDVIAENQAQLDEFLASK